MTLTKKTLSGLKKLKYDKEHEHELTMYENTRADLKTLLAEGEKITPKHGGQKKNSLKRKCRSFGVNGRGRVMTLHLRK